MVACLRPSSPLTKQTPASTPPVWLRGNSCGYPPPAPFAPFVVVIVDVVRSTSRGRRERERERECYASPAPPPPISRVTFPGEAPDPSNEEPPPPLVSEESARRIALHRDGPSPPSSSSSDDMRRVTSKGLEVMVRERSRRSRASRL